MVFVPLQRVDVATPDQVDVQTFDWEKAQLDITHGTVSLLADVKSFDDAEWVDAHLFHLAQVAVGVPFVEIPYVVDDENTGDGVKKVVAVGHVL